LEIVLWISSQKLNWQVKSMKRFIIEQSDDEFYPSTSGIALVGLALNRFTNIASSLAKAVPLSHGISSADVIRSYCALLAQGKSDFAAIEQHREDDFFRPENRRDDGIPAGFRGQP